MELIGEQPQCRSCGSSTIHRTDQGLRPSSAYIVGHGVRPSVERVRHATCGECKAEWEEITIE